MKRNDITDLRAKSLKDLQKILSETQKDLARTKLELAMVKHTNKHVAQSTRRKNAVVKTLIREKEMAQNTKGN